MLREYFLPDHAQTYWNFNEQTFTSIVHFIFVELNNYTCIKSSMAPQ